MGACGWYLLLLTVWFFVFTLIHPFDIQPALATGGPPHPKPGWSVLRSYLPLIGWGPLVIAVAANHHRRRAGHAAPEPAGSR